MTPDYHRDPIAYVAWLTAKARCVSRDWAMLLLDSEALHRDVRALRSEARGLAERGEGAGR